MEDLFELVIIIVVAVLGIMSKSKKKKKKAADKPAMAAEPISEPAKPVAAAPKAVSSSIEDAVAAFSELLELNETPPKPAKAQTAPQSAVKESLIETEMKQTPKGRLKLKKAQKTAASGESPTDEHGCIGGSMPVHNAEGETLAEHAEHEKNRLQHLRDNAPRVEDLRHPSRQELRKAIVMSEVLNKPVSLRGRRI